MAPISTQCCSLRKVTFESLDSITQQALQKAVVVRENAYCPYSKFKVGACVVAEDGSIFTGCNVENSTYTAICAERTAYVKAVSEGHQKYKLVAVVAYQEDNVTPPCGTCLQFMSEFGNATVYLSKPNLQEVFFCEIRDLLPLQFHKELD